MRMRRAARMEAALPGPNEGRGLRASGCVAGNSSEASDGVSHRPAVGVFASLHVDEVSGTEASGDIR